MTVIHSRSGAQTLTVLPEDEAGERVTILLQHVDEFDSSQDVVTVGEFAAHDIIAALVPPLPASRHVAAEPLRRRRPWRRK